MKKKLLQNLWLVFLIPVANISGQMFMDEALQAYQSREFAKAMEWVDKGLETERSRPAFLRMKGLILIELEDGKQSRKIWRELLKENETGEFLFQLGRAEQLLGRIKKAEYHFQSAAENPAPEYRGWLEASRLRAMRHDFANAKADLRLYLANVLDLRAPAHDLLARIYAAEDSLEKSFQETDRLLQFNPDASVYTLRGMISSKLNQNYDAVKEFSSAVEKSPEDGYALEKRAAAALHMTFTHTAMEDYKQLQEMEGCECAGWLGMARLRMKMDLWEGAESDILNAIKVCQSAESWAALAELALHNYDWEKAKSALKEAIRINRRSGYAWDVKESYLLRMKKTGAASRAASRYWKYTLENERVEWMNFLGFGK